MDVSQLPGPDRRYAAGVFRHELNIPLGSEEAAGLDGALLEEAQPGLTSEEALEEILAAARGPVRWLAPAAFRMRKAIKMIPLVGSLALRIKNRYLLLAEGKTRSKFYR